MLSALASHLAMIAGVALTVVITPKLLRQRRSATSTTAWLLAILLVPWVGLPAYLLFGGRKIKGDPLEKPSLATGPKPELRPAQQGADLLLQSYGLPPARPGNRVALCADGEDIYRRFLETIEGAERHIHMASFILHPDAVGRRIIEALAQRARCGVEVRLLLDGFGSFGISKRDLDPLQRAGGETAFFLPVRLRTVTRTNLRNHRKMLIADDLRAVAGGANVACDYMGPPSAPARWRDLSFLIEGPAVADYADVFAADWRFATGREVSRAAPAQPVGEAVAQIAASGPDVPGDPVYAAIVSASYAARRRLWVVTPYFIPPDPLAEALALAAHRGVDVRVYVPDPSNHPVADLARGQALRDAAAAGVHVIRFVGGMVHAKIFIADDGLAMVGSVNLDPRSLFLNFEVNAVFYGAAEIAAVVNWIETLKDRTEKGVPPVSNLRDAVEGAARLLDPLL
ncbi:phospholipase D-like domain-containing protein [Methylocella sp.]|uniref:phospholipase D-like domain-containing protein n=1 Tax=Methylocella sp. TaxID=1978226 RepID=UPI0037838831